MASRTAGLVTVVAIWGSALGAGSAARGAPQELRLDPVATSIRFTLGATLHTVEGSLRLDHGSLRFDPDAGSAEGEIVIDAKSARDGPRAAATRTCTATCSRASASRASSSGPSASKCSGATPRAPTCGSSGQLELHGTPRPFAIPARLAARGDKIGIASSFRVDYVDWGMVDYSTFVLRVDRFVDVTLEAEGRLAAP